MLTLSKQKIAVTGSAGFIGFHVTRALLEQGIKVYTLDNINDYYDVELKKTRLNILNTYKNHVFHLGGIEDKTRIDAFFAEAKPDIIIHLAAQAGVRYSLTNPQAYIDSNIQGFMNILEAARNTGVSHLVYASSSSVYGASKTLPFSETDPVNQPLSLYAATKKTNELMAYTYNHLYNLRVTGLRFFTVYGPWGRPDMAVFLFTKAIATGQPIDVYNYGDMRRDFTYIDDIVHGTLEAAKRPRQEASIYNLGNNKPSDLPYLIALIEKGLSRDARKNLLPLQPGDLPETYADIERARKDLGFTPKTSLETGIQAFIDWYKAYYKV